MKPPRTAIDQIEFMRNLLAFLLVGAFITVLPVFAFHVIPKENEQIITYMVGQLSGMATMALGFYFINKVGQDALDAKRADNTGKMADLAKEALKPKGEDASAAAEETAGAAVDKAEEIRRDQA